MAVRTELSEARTKTTEGQYSLVRFVQAKLVSSLLHGIVFLDEETLPVISFKSTSVAIFRGFDDDASNTETSGIIYNTSFKTFRFAARTFLDISKSLSFRMLKEEPFSLKYLWILH